MGRVLALFFFFTIVGISAFAQKDSSQPRLFIDLELGIIPVKSQGSETLNCYQGQLGLSYCIFSKMRAGLFGQTLQYYQNLNIANIDDKIIELVSIDYHTIGVFFCYAFSVRKFRLIPKLDIGYNLFTAKSLDYEQDNSSFLDYRYLSLNPKLGIGYAISENLTLGILGGYNLQMSALKGQKLETFDTNNYSIGLSASIGIGR